MANAPGGNNRKHWVCSVCDAPHYCRGYCTRHYQRWRQHGNPEVRLTREWPQPTYWAVHLRLHRDRGSATNHLCARCLQPADEWAYDHTDPAPLTGPTKPDGSLVVRYSANPDCYQPMCHSCHITMDKAGAC